MKNISINLPLKKSDVGKLLLASQLVHGKMPRGLFGDKTGTILWTKTSEVDAVISRLSGLGLNANARTVLTLFWEFPVNIMKCGWVAFLANITLLIAFVLSVHVLLKEVPMRDDPILWGMLSLVIIVGLFVMFSHRLSPAALTSSKTMEASFEILEGCNYNANSAKSGNHLVSIFSAPVAKGKVRRILVAWGIASLSFLFLSLFAPAPFRGFCIFISLLFIFFSFREQARSEGRELIWSCTKERFLVEDRFSQALILDLDATTIRVIRLDGNRIIISHGEKDNFSFDVNEDSETVTKAVFWANEILISTSANQE